MAVGKAEKQIRKLEDKILQVEKKIKRLRNKIVMLENFSKKFFVTI
ncbi:putative nucleic acid-binding Zn-ribbon protein [Clostridium acetobutylicum]|nr:MULTISPECIES: hypothetical protein [Clostridium]MBC2395244.1 hypothetical protein [Clostridium acetobutylicum]MBC2585394.1 hypothetical protein [Clostridium acetobutylicum]NOV89883.1 putative nucleic acid-binding Zn-ribbon protein [Clostridium acetobutylicum]NOW15588.1 putative nucleic acid-binding Zn-ribbon protein [Clostridium acetobutylicum]NRY57267.1 putative nucleic acid-binding Zn-ribbon protein [Clostridium acetobutylicum]